MPFINEDGTIDTWKGYIRKCDNCGNIEKIFDELTGEHLKPYEEVAELENHIRLLFRGVRSHGLPDVLCVDCMKSVLPNLYKLRDVIELDIFVNKLWKAINEKENNELKTTGQLRAMLANAAKGVLNGDLDIDRAMALHKLAKNISESLYSETKIAMFNHEVGKAIPEMGNLPLGESND